MPAPSRAVVARAVFVALLAVSLYLFLAPVPSGDGGSDKVGHLAIFGVLAVAGRGAGLRPLPLAVGLAAWAGLTELLQASLPVGRHGDPADALADMVGVGLGLGAVALLSRARRAAPSPSRPRG